MPSTYSPNLKIELMATGEKAGQWGTVTNDNLQNAIEAAIVGESTITFAGVDETLVLGDTTAPQDARSLKLNLVGTFGGTKTLNLPAVKKSYLIRNGSTGGDANNVIIKVTSSAGATVTIPSGRTMFVYVDSVNVVEGFNHFNSLSITTPLPSSSGGTGLSAPGANGNILLSNGTSWQSVVPAVQLTASNTFALPSPGSNETLGYLNIPQNVRSTAYTLTASDAGKHLLHPGSDSSARTFNIPSNSSVPYAIGTAITFVNQNGAGVLTIAITSDTMRLAGPGTTGSRTLAANGVATAIKITSTEWIISGIGLT